MNKIPLLLIPICQQNIWFWDKLSYQSMFPAGYSECKLNCSLDVPNFWLPPIGKYSCFLANEKSFWLVWFRSKLACDQIPSCKAISFALPLVPFCSYNQRFVNIKLTCDQTVICRTFFCIGFCLILCMFNQRFLNIFDYILELISCLAIKVSLLFLLNSITLVLS